MAFSDVPVGAAVQACPINKPKPEFWIEIELVGEDNRPIPWEAYEVILPDQVRVQGYLDIDGFARFEGLEQGGTCQVRFPELDRDAWEFISTLPMKSP